MRRLVQGLAIVMFVLFFIQGVSAEVIVHNDTIKTKYSTGERISGMMTITFNKTNLDSTIRTNFDNTTMSLRDFIAANGLSAGAHYNCSTANCLAGYVRKEAIDSFDLRGGNSLLGFIVEDPSITRIDYAEVDFQSTAEPSCYLELAVDVLNKSEYLVTSADYLDESCYEPRYGCFERARAGADKIVMEPGKEYCERMTLPISPAFRLGANITNATQGKPGLKMRIHALDSALLGECILPNLTQSSQMVECISRDGSALQRDYFVCVMSTGANSNYQIRVETNDPCGTNNFGGSYPGDYEVFAKNLKFNTPRIHINESEFKSATGADLSEYMSLYLSDYYDNKCTPYCVVPIRIFGSDQTITVANPSIRYTGSIGQRQSFEIYTIEKSGVTFDASRVNVDLSKTNFTIPLDARGNRLRIYIDNKEILEKTINLTTTFSFDLEPLFVTFGQPTTFSVVTSANISSVRWTFGDGSATQTSSGKNISYRYTRQGTFNVEVDVTRADGVTSRRTFVVSSGDARSAALSLNATVQQRWNALVTNLSGYPVWMRNILKAQLGYDALNTSVREAALLVARAVNTTNESDYVLAVNAMVAMDMPSRMQNQVAGTVPLVLALEYADMETLRTWAGKQEGTDEELRASLGMWAIEHSDADISFNSIAGYYDSGARPLVTFFKIQTKPRTTFESGSALIIGVHPDDLTFAGNYSPKQIGTAATSIALGAGGETFEFGITDSILPEQLGAYITPPFAKLGTFSEMEYTCNFNAECDSKAGETWKNCPNDCRPWGLASVIILVLVFCGAVVLGAILWWYKTRYESSLFAHRQDLVNVLTFITTSSRAGMAPHEIQTKLKHAGWTREQITYAFAKHAKSKGSNVPASNDVRFIKRPDFKSP